MTGGELSRSIEMLSLMACQAWEMLVEDCKNVARIDAAVSAINPQKLVVFGGFNRGFLNTGYVLDITSKQVKCILGKAGDFAFRTFTQTQWTGNKRHVTLGEDKDGFLHLVQL